MKNEKFKSFGCEINQEKFPIVISEKAQAMAIRALKNNPEEDLFLRISIRGGGCAGLQYNLDIDDRCSPFDVTCHYGDLKVTTDIFSLQYLTDTNIDYQENLDGAGFKFHNPHARKTCGCGSSFS
jgi:iron-sulfur cluster assembly protein